MTVGTTLIEQRIKRTFAADTAEVRSVRRFVRERAATALNVDKLADLDLAVSELASNAVQHGCGSTFDVSLAIGAHSVGVEVRSRHIGHTVCAPSTWAPQQPSALSGRGLHLVRTVCDAVYVSTDDNDITVGCLLDFESDCE